MPLAMIMMQMRRKEAERKEEIVCIQLPAPLDKLRVPIAAEDLPGLYLAYRCMDDSGEAVSVETMDKILNYAHQIGVPRGVDLGDVISEEQIKSALRKFDQLASVSERMSLVKNMPLSEAGKFIQMLPMVENA